MKTIIKAIKLKVINYKSQLDVNHYEPYEIVDN